MVEIREMSEKDLYAVLMIENQCFISPWPKADILTDWKDNQYSRWLVILVDDVVAGFIDYWITFDSATICQIAIQKGYRRLGLASKLLDEMFKDCYAEKVRNITLEVRGSNEAAISLYKKYGFKFVVSKEGYYSDGEDAHYFVKEVNING